MGTGCGDTELVAAAQGVVWGSFVISGVWLSVRDIRTHRLPNRGVAAAGLLAVVSVSVLAWLSRDLALFVRAGASAIILCGAYLTLFLLGGMGMGDVKYAGVIGLYLGSQSWWALWWGTLIAFALASCWGTWVRLRRKAIRPGTFAFGPAMVAGAGLGVWWSAGTPWLLG